MERNQTATKILSVQTSHYLEERMMLLSKDLPWREDDALVQGTLVDTENLVQERMDDFWGGGGASVLVKHYTLLDAAETNNRSWDFFKDFWTAKINTAKTLQVENWKKKDFCDSRLVSPQMWQPNWTFLNIYLTLITRTLCGAYQTLCCARVCEACLSCFCWSSEGCYDEGLNTASSPGWEVEEERLLWL